MIGKSKVTSGGICQALSEMWVVFHAHDESIWNWLYPGGQLSSSAIANLSYNFSLGSASADGKISAVTNQDQNSDLWFMQYGIRRRTNIIPQMSNVFVDGAMHKVAFGQRSISEGVHSGSRMDVALSSARTW
jgi:hypothetical protein